MAASEGTGEQHAAASLRPSAPSGRVDDAAHALTPAARTSLEDVIREIEATSGDRLWVSFISDQAERPLAAKAAALYASRGLAAQPPLATVLVLVDVAHKRAALETGQGVEGPLTSLEAERLLGSVAPLLDVRDWAGAAAQLVRAVSSTATATRARRKPPPPLPDTEDAVPREDARAGTREGAFKGEWGWFSRLAGAIAAFFLLLVAVRQRRRAQERDEMRPPAPAKKYLGPPRIDR